jgi:hypothetical protein
MGRMLRHDMRRTLSMLRDNATRLSQDVLNKIGDGYIVAGVNEIDSEFTQIEAFITSLPNTEVGLAMRSKKLTLTNCKQQLLNDNNFGSAKGETQSDWVEANINSEWYDRLSTASKSDLIKFDSLWLSEARVKEVTGIGFKPLCTKQIAAADRIYVVSEADLEASETPVHWNRKNTEKTSIWINRNLPRSYWRRSDRFKYYPADNEDGYVPREELQNLNPTKRTYKPDSFERPPEKFF